mmetsp:Transcript_9876/g.14626  ORF Transcript_9876/g.14626 Transcript_9876/m.14626 type:complete len:1416 (-) Transcript_9876:162-4409(-)
MDSDDLPNQVIPRGIAARTNGMEEFLSALRRGIVVRRHRANAEPAFVKIHSKDGGDTIKYTYVPPEEAMIALKEQRVRYNKQNHNMKRDNNVTLKSASKRWSKDNGSVSSDYHYSNPSKSLPDYIAAKQYRDEQSKKQGGIIYAVTDLATKLVHSGTIKAADVVVVHPARHQDPYASDGELGTGSLRDSPAEYVIDNSFSIVLPAMRDWLPTQNMRKDASEKWCAGEGSNSSFWSLDIELATSGEYWVVFRGFLLLHRDAAYGRFAAQRACGFGSHYNRRELEMIEQKREISSAKPVPFRSFFKRHTEANVENLEEQSKQSMEFVKKNDSCDKFFEPPTRSAMVRTALHLSTRVQSILTGPNEKERTRPVKAVPPPSDYFLGFKSSGTQIWSRLRQAGLETTRIYALDKKRVMIKLRCPPERLMDVAEVLRLKLKTRDGVYAPFRESMISQYLPTNDGVPRESYSSNPASLFRSSERQAIIDFIIRSRIRDSGAELGQGTDLGKKIHLRVPLHMHARLESLYEGWVLYWKMKNWVGGHSGYSMTVERDNSFEHSSLRSANSSSSAMPQRADSADDDSQTEFLLSEEENTPSIFARFVVGSLYQPLDSIEEYFGEKVAFYFAWLQHCSYHLTYMSVIGLIVFLIQAITGKWDHPIRPFFSIIVMIWSFYVMVTWRQRSNFLAQRWGTLNYEEEETTRPQFKGEYQRCEITKEWVIHYPSWKRWLKYCISLPLTAAFTLAVSILILVVHANRDILLARYFELKKNHGEVTTGFDFSIGAIGRQGPINSVDLNKENLQDPKFWFLVVGLPTLLGLSLPLLNFLLMKVSVTLNNFENYRTESEYRNHLIMKVFSFRFVCYFASLYYYAYFTNGTDEKSVESSILRVGASLFIYLTISNWWMFLLTIYFPLLIHRWRIYCERLKLRDELRCLEKTNEEDADQTGPKYSTEVRDQRNRLINKRLLLEQAQSSVWEEMMLRQHDSFPEYVLAVIQFAYVTCFSVVLPITPLFCLFNQLLMMRLDAYKLCRGRRRPLAQKTGGIGVWENVLHIVTVVAVLTNCSLVALTSSQFVWLGEKLGQLGLFALVVGWEHIMLFIKYLMQSSFPKYPLSVQDALKKERYQISRRMNSNMRAKKERRSLSARLKSLDSTEKEVAKIDMRISKENVPFSKEGNEKKTGKKTLPLTREESYGLPAIASMSDSESSPLLPGEFPKKTDQLSVCSGAGIYDKMKRDGDDRSRKINCVKLDENIPVNISKTYHSKMMTPKTEITDAKCLPTPRQINLTEDFHSISCYKLTASQDKLPRIESPFGMYVSHAAGLSSNSSRSPHHSYSCTPNKILSCKSIDDDASLFSCDGDTPMTAQLSPFSKLIGQEAELMENAIAEERIRKRLSSLEEEPHATRFVDSRRRGGQMIKSEANKNR